MYDKNFLKAQRLAKRLANKTESPAVQKIPTCVRKHLVPKVQIGALRDPAAPIRIAPAITLAGTAL